MRQSDIINNLNIKITQRYFGNKSWSVIYSLKNNIYNYLFERFLRESNLVLINQLSELINENCIDLKLFKEYGLLKVVKADKHIKTNCLFLEQHITNSYSAKCVSIDKILHAILVIDYSLNFNDLTATSTTDNSTPYLN